ncbi:hypothetical protein [Aureivirga marina]|uniref:hypothetical protein n=1 Tax=Aureivirga marina TaxID=1182451 RepID=UPI0018CAA53C|nr:hypothetical protein [Aureivirga marina]
MSEEIVKSLILFKKEKSRMSKEQKKVTEKNLRKETMSMMEKIINKIEVIGENINNY